MGFLFLSPLALLLALSSAPLPAQAALSQTDFNAQPIGELALTNIPGSTLKTTALLQKAGYQDVLPTTSIVTLAAVDDSSFANPG